MTRLALCVVVWSPCIVLLAQEPKKPSEFEGAWQEPTRLGEDPTLRYKITFAGEKVTIHYREQVLTGTFQINSKSDRPITITMTITEVKGVGSHTSGTYGGIFEVTKDRASFHFDPSPVRVSSVREVKLPGDDKPRIIVIAEPAGILKPVPFTLTLHKVTK